MSKLFKLFKPKPPAQPEPSRNSSEPFAYLAAFTPTPPGPAESSRRQHLRKRAGAKIARAKREPWILSPGNPAHRHALRRAVRSTLEREGIIGRSRPYRRERRPGCNHHRAGSRRQAAGGGKTRAGPGDSDPPDDPPLTRRQPRHIGEILPGVLADLKLRSASASFADLLDVIPELSGPQRRKLLFEEGLSEDLRAVLIASDGGGSGR